MTSPNARPLGGCESVDALRLAIGKCKTNGGNLFSADSGPLIKCGLGAHLALTGLQALHSGHKHGQCSQPPPSARCTR